MQVVRVLPPGLRAPHVRLQAERAGRNRRARADAETRHGEEEEKGALQETIAQYADNMLLLLLSLSSVISYILLSSLRVLFIFNFSLRLESLII